MCYGVLGRFLIFHLRIEERALAYQVIARKWRPKTFGELVGQDHVSQTLLNALRSERLPHALLFTGPRGTGKTSSARLLAKSLRCPNAKDFIPCNVCKDCQDISAGRSFDVHELDGASNNGVDAIRELQDSVRSMPSSGKYKLYIIDEVHMLSISAFNALLKTLEEPPSHVVFILATTEVQKLPNTILSRCQRFDFRRIPTRQVAAHLKHICEEDNVSFDEESLWMLARQGEGSMRDSQSLLDQVITYTNSDLSQEKVIEILGLTDRGLLLDAVRALCLRQTEQILDVIERISKSGHDTKVFCNELLESLRNLLLVKVNPDRISEIIDLPDSEIEALADLGVSMSEEDVHMLFDMCLKGASDIARASDPRLVLEMTLLRMAAAPTVHSLAALMSGKVAASSATSAATTQKKNPELGTTQRVSAKPAAPKPSAPTSAPSPDSLKKFVTNMLPTSGGDTQRQPNQAQAPASAPATPAKNENIFDEKVSATDNWFHFVSKLKQVDATIAAQLENTHVVELKDDQLNLGLPNTLQFLHDQFRNKNFIEKLTGLLERFWGKKLEVAVNLVSTNSALSPKEAAKVKKDEEDSRIRKEVEEHPLVQAAQRDLNLKISKINKSKN